MDYLYRTHNRRKDLKKNAFCKLNLIIGTRTVKYEVATNKQRKTSSERVNNKKLRD